jgi:uncharacterized protein (TIGR02246 family)
MDLAAEQVKVLAIEDALLKAVMAKDATNFADNYAADATMVVPGMQPFNGKDAIREGMKTIFEDPNFKLTFSSLGADVSKSADLAFTRGTYRSTLSDAKTGDPVREEGSYVTVFQKQLDGNYKVIADINTNGPPLPPK